MSNFQYRIIRYDTTTGTRLGPGPRASSLEASAPLNDVPALKATFDDPQSIVRAPAEVAVELSTDNGATWTEPPNMRFAIIVDDEDEIISPDKPQPSAVGMFWLLKKAVVHVESGPLDADGRRAWSSITPGTLIRTLVQEAQARGVLGWLDMSTFSSTTDSNGTTWPSTFSTSHEIGVSYDSIIQTLADVGLIDFQMVGRSLRVYVPDTYLAPTVSNVTLVEGKDYTEATKKTTYELVASRNLVKGDGISTVIVDAAADKPWGEWEVTTSAGGSTTLGDLNLLANVGYARSSLRQTQRTFTVYPNNPSSPKPWIDYKVGDKIKSVTKKTVTTDLRVRQMTIRANRTSCLVTLVLGDRLLERDVRMQRLLKAASGGVAGAGSNGTFPSSSTEDTIEPSPPTALMFESSAVLINGGIIADLTGTWTAPTTNANGTILDDFDHYEVQYKRTIYSDSYWKAGGTTTTTTLTVGGLVPGVSYDFRVRTVDKSTNVSTWLSGTYTTNQDGTAPNTPSTGTVVADLGILFYYWNGKDNLGNAMPSDFAELRLYMSTTSGFTPGTSNFYTALPSYNGGRIPIGDLTYGTTYFFKTSAVDIAGNESGFSTQVSGIPVRVTGLDIDALTIETTNLGDGAITEAKIANLAVTTGKIFNAAIVNAKIGNLEVDDAKIANVSIGKLTVGSLTADLTVSARIKTNNSGARTEMNTSGFEAYNSSNVRTFFVSAATGNVTTTGVFQTSVSGQRIVIDSTGTYPTIWMNDNTGATAAFINSPGAGLGANSSTAANGSETTYTRTWWQPTTASLEMVLGSTTTTLRGGQYSVGYTNAITSARDNSQVIRSQTEWNNGQSLRMSVYNSSAQESTKFNMSGSDSYWEYKTTGTQQYYGRFLLDNTGAHVTGWDAAGHQMAKLDAGSAEALLSSYNTSGSLLSKISAGSLETYMEWKSGGVDPKCRLTLDNTNGRLSGYNGSVVRSQVTANSSDARLDSYTSGGATNGTVNTGGAEVYVQWLGGSGNIITRLVCDGTNARLEGYNGGSLDSRITCTGNVTRMEHVSTGNGFEGSSTGPKIFGVVAPGGTPTAIGVDAGLVRFMSSSARYKTRIQEVDIDVDDWLKLRPVTYVFKADIEENDDVTEDNAHVHVGLIAEEVHARKLGESMVSYNDGEVESIYPLSAIAAQQGVLRNHHDRLRKIEEILEAAGLN